MRPGDALILGWLMKHESAAQVCRTFVLSSRVGSDAPVVTNASPRQGILMHHRMRWVLLVLAVVPGIASAQTAPTPRVGTARAVLLAEPLRAPEPRVQPLEGRARGAAIGFVVGAGLGAAAGYGAYNALCEAVDNHCDGSRALWMIVGGLALGGVGALAGLLLD